MSEHFNKLTPAQAELIACLAEEAGEIVQMCGKILRHGLDSVNPVKPEEGTNTDRLMRELSDLRAIELLLHREGVIDLLAIDPAAKLKRMPPWMHHVSIAEAAK